MQRITNIRFIFIVAVLVVATACGTSSPSVHPSPVPNATQANTPVSPEPTLTPIPTEIPATPEPPAEPDFESTLEGEALAQYERLSEEHGLDIEGMARFLGTETVTDWLAVISGLASDRFASGLEGDDRERHGSLSRLERYTFELIALIEQDLAMEWLSAGPGRLDMEGERVGQDHRGARIPAEAFAPDIAQTDSGFPRAPIIEREALVQYARLNSEGRAAFEFLVKVVGLEAAEEQLLPLREWNDLFFHPPPIFAAPLPSLENALSPDEAGKLGGARPAHPRSVRGELGGWTAYTCPGPFRGAGLHGPEGVRGPRGGETREEAQAKADGDPCRASAHRRYGFCRGNGRVRSVASRSEAPVLEGGWSRLLKWNDGRG